MFKSEIIELIAKAITRTDNNCIYYYLPECNDFADELANNHNVYCGTGNWYSLDHVATLINEAA